MNATASRRVHRRGVLREMATIHSLNLLQLDFRRKVFVAQLWVPTAQVAQLHDALQAGALAAVYFDGSTNAMVDTPAPSTSVLTGVVMSIDSAAALPPKRKPAKLWKEALPAETSEAGTSAPPMGVDATAYEAYSRSS